MEKTNLNLIPEKEKPIVNASQFDDGRVIRFILKDGEGAYIPVGGESVSCNIRKPDNNIVTISCTLTSIVEDEETIGSYVDVVLTEQANACVGEAFGELVLTKEDNFVIGTCNFVLSVERSPIAGGVTSTTVIDDLYTQVEEITVQVIGDDYYTKTQVDDLLDLKADAATTYTKTEVDAALALKADKSTTYTKTQVDSALALKADASSVYTKGQVDTALALKADAATTYTKTEVDTALALKANTADLATVATTGDYDDLTNKPTIPAAQVQSDWDQSDNTKVDYIKNKPDLSVYPTVTEVGDLLYDMLPIGTASGAIATFDTDLALPLVDCKANIVASGGGGTPSTPIPINGYTEANITANGDTVTIAFGQTVYGGVLDVTTGVLTVTWGRLDLGTLSWNYNSTLQLFYCKLGATQPNYNYDGIIDSYEKATSYNVNNYQWYNSNYIGSGFNLFIKDTDYSDAPTFKTHMSGVYMAYELATPFDIDITPVQINAIVGTNNIYNDTNGDTEVEYKDTIQHYIDTRI